ncbi:MAG TPA: Rossmann-like and DUF2520 domain-containing protein [Pyrinomonadaceae bacterium]|nr:Rossmann-like and DUF2520 domain-containing protein [Pyrinomonadaceae bacterium]
MGTKSGPGRSTGARPRRELAQRPTVSIVGAGRLGTALACALATHGYTIEAVVARSLTHARRAARIINTKPLALTSAELGSLPQSSIIFITTPDDAIAATAAAIASSVDDCESAGKSRRQRVALHASGALSSDVLQSLREVGFATGSLHPLVSVSEPRQGAQSLGSAFFCVEGSNAAVRAARRMVSALGAQSFSIGTRDKSLYHAAAVMASGHVTALFDIAMEMLAQCNLEPRRARAILLPLLKSTLENLRATAPARALTGTFARADVATVRRHLAALRSTQMEDALAAYLLLGRRSLRLAKTAGAPAAALREIARALDEAEKRGAPTNRGRRDET